MARNVWIAAPAYTGQVHRGPINVSAVARSSFTFILTNSADTTRAVYWPAVGG